ncbi:dTDP-4-dehydrorhamnose 3,5-epimerase [Candidatus Pelagibacter sp.]|uniref:dTDP-4-dehydrorhamnose 3,5-epimerase n=1 Tax=Candidatus Pelagibacter sp. TaxID=2024849 RepID=UPI003F874170|tara:strand:- start:3234 stop:3755 length:522 start_codon:yes stop_codon:yes gene_type:complete
MKILKTKFKGLLIFKSKNFTDKRGYFREIAHQKKINEKLIFTVVSKSKKNVLRGLHMQTKFMQGKYVSVVKGEILDVAVDCRKNSKTYGEHFKIKLSQKNSKSIYIPPGFLHGFLGKKKENIIVYSCTNYRNKNSEISVSWKDKDLAINWEIRKPILSNKDAKNSIPFNKLKI